jgi:uncharacterized protein YneF (UPF0154 family)
MLTLLFLLVLLIILYFIVRKVIRQKMIIEQLKNELSECKIQVKKERKKTSKR